MAKTKVKFKQWNCIANFEKYKNNERIAIELVDEKTKEPIAMASVNLPDIELLSGTIAIKDYSENAGMALALHEAGIIGKRLDNIVSGHVIIGIYELLKTK